MPTKQWLQVEFGNEIMMHFLSSFHIQSRFQTIVRSCCIACTRLYSIVMHSGAHVNKRSFDGLQVILLYNCMVTSLMC